MTISTPALPLSYAGNGSTTAFAITWAYILKSHVVATLRDAAGAEAVQILGIDYTLTNPGASGTLTMTVAPATNETLVITSEPPNTQETDIPLGGSFPAKSVEDMGDVASQVSQKIENLFDRALRVPKTDTRSGSELELPNETDRASKFLAFDVDGNPIASASSIGTTVVSPFAETYLDDLTAEATRATLGVATISETTLEAASDSLNVSAGQIKNHGIAFSVGSSALTAALKTSAGTDPSATDKVTVSMRNATLATGTFNIRTITAALSLVISSGSTLGHISTIAGIIHWYLIDNAGTLELAASAAYHGETGIITTTVEGGAGGADSGTLMYSTVARTSVAFKWIGKTIDTQTTAGTWAAVPTSVQLKRDLEMPPSIEATISGSALTIKLSPCKLSFRSETIGVGQVVELLTGELSITVPSGATLGTISTVLSRIVILAINNKGTIELAVVNIDGGLNIDETTLINTTAIDSSSDTKAIPYSDTARTAVPLVVVGVVVSTQTVAGTWDSSPTNVQSTVGGALKDMGSIGYGQKWTDVVGSRSAATDYYNDTGRPIQVSVISTLVAGGATISGLVDGLTVAQMLNNTSGAHQYTVAFIVPPGSKYRINVTTFGIVNWHELR